MVTRCCLVYSDYEWETPCTLDTFPLTYVGLSENIMLCSAIFSPRCTCEGHARAFSSRRRHPTENVTWIDAVAEYDVCARSVCEGVEAEKFRRSTTWDTNYSRTLCVHSSLFLLHRDFLIVNTFKPISICLWWNVALIYCSLLYHLCRNLLMNTNAMILNGHILIE